MDGPVTYDEIRGWYMYDWANSPYYQVYTTALMPIVLKWLAEGHSGGWIENDSNATLATVTNTTDHDTTDDLVMPGLGINAGSYPLAVSFVTIFLQTVCLLSFSAYGDYGNYRKRLLVGLTYGAAFFVFLNIFCFSSSMWWFAGIARIFAGVLFVMCGVYYNSFLPTLASQHVELVGLPPAEKDERVVELTDEISNKGQIIGYFGGFSMLIISYIILLFFECDQSTTYCSEFAVLFPPNVCIALVAIWWGVFAIYSFMKLKARPGEPLPENVGMCLGCQSTCGTLGLLPRYRNLMIFLCAYFIYSDAINTTTTIAILILEDTSDASLSATVFSAILGVLGSFVGGLIFMAVQKFCNTSARGTVIFQLGVLFAVCIPALCGVITAFNGFGFYLVMAPVLLVLGSIQAYSRSIFSTLVPVGKEAAMFSFFEVTDKGSNLIGTFVSFLIRNATNSYLGTFWYLLVAYTISIILMCFVDVEQGMVDAGKAAGYGLEPGLTYGGDYDSGDEDDEGTGCVVA